jgi:hypothetical protein
LSTGSLTDRQQSDQIGTYPKSKTHKLRLVETLAGIRLQAGKTRRATVNKAGTLTLMTKMGLLQF